MGFPLDLIFGAEIWHLNQGGNNIYGIVGGLVLQQRKKAGVGGGEEFMELPKVLSSQEGYHLPGTHSSQFPLTIHS